jgi:BirA family transcriptional regulator, biotin operon repressor / biotin---[acetyl-CoA-carboxylase] ligase
VSDAAPTTDALQLIGRLAGGDWVSGETLAAEYGVSRAAVAKRVTALARWGITVASRHGLGYRIEPPLQLLDAAAMAAPDGLSVSVVPVTTSTNADLLEADARHDPQARLAEYQIAGRGRRGRVWQAPYGQQIMASLAWSFPTWPTDLGCLPLAVGMTLAHTLHAEGAGSVQVKWPNDLVVRDRKLGGVLMEHRGEIGGACRVVIGFGLNLRRFAADREPDQPWTSLDQLIDTPPERNALCGRLLSALYMLLHDYADHGFAPWQAHWPALDASAGRPVRLLGGTPVVEGIACGIDARGALQVDCDGQRVAVHSGEVSLRWA